MKIATIEEWGEHNPCMSYEDLRTPFEEFMRFEYSEPNLEWNSLCGFYQEPDVELGFQGFCEGAFFMCHHKEKDTSGNQFVLDAQTAMDMLDSPAEPNEKLIELLRMK